MIVQAPNKTTALKTAKKLSDEHNSEWGFPLQSWEVYEIYDKNGYESPEDKIVLSVTM